MDQVDQFNIDFRNKKEKLLNFLDTFATGKQRVNIHVNANNTENEIDIILAIWDMNLYNIAICFDSEVEFEKIKSKEIPYYYSTLIDNWESLNTYLDKGVESVFISGNLAFDLKQVSKRCKEKKVRIRCYPNFCQYNWDNSDGIKTFFIRPEDVDLYGEYIDLLEFWNSEDKQNPLYEIYFHDKKWDGDLREIIYGLKQKVNSYYMLGDFGSLRLDCRRNCIRSNNCNLCGTIVDFGNTIEESKEYQIFER